MGLRATHTTIALSLVLTSAAAQVSNYVASENTAGLASDGSGFSSQLSATGRFVVFNSRATDIVSSVPADDLNIYRHDLATRETELVSQGVSGTEDSNEPCFSSDGSADGRYVVWRSTATNLASPAPTTSGQHAYLRDMDLGVTIQLDRATTTSGPGGVVNLRITPDGRYVLLKVTGAFDPADTNGRNDLYRYEVATGALVPVSTTESGHFGSSGMREFGMSDDGRFIVFSSSSPDILPASNHTLTSVYLKDMDTAELTRVSESPPGVTQSYQSDYPTISGDGNVIAFTSTNPHFLATDSNNGYDLIVLNRLSGLAQNASLTTAGAQVTNFTWLTPSELSHDGSMAIYESGSNQLVPGDTNGSRDIFLSDLTAGTLTRVNLAYDGSELPLSSRAPSMSADGQRISFNTLASGVVEGADGGIGSSANPSNTYVRDLQRTGIAGANYCAAAPNSTGQTAVIGAEGDTQVQINLMSLNASQLPPQSFGFFITSLSAGFVLNPGGSQGNLCLSGAIGRYAGPGQVLNSGAEGRFSLDLNLNNIPTPTGPVGVLAGETRHFQAWVRDSIQGMATSNFSNAVSVEFN